MKCRLSSEARAPAVARGLVSEFMETIFGEVANEREVHLVVSELVTNAVQHGSPPIDLMVRASRDELLLDVTDTSPDLPAVVESADRVDGMGLMIVTGLTTMWGVVEHESGKTVLCRMPIKRVRS